MGILHQAVRLCVERFDAGTDTIKERYIAGVRKMVLGCFRGDCLRIFDGICEGKNVRVAVRLVGLVHVTILCLT